MPSRCPTFIALLSCVVTGAAAAPPAKPDPSAKEAAAFLADAVQRYRGFASYQDTFRMRLITEVLDEAGDDIGINVGGRATVRLRDANEFVFISKKATVYYADGHATWVRPELGQYIRQKHPPDLSPILLRFTGPLSQHPVAIVTLAGKQPLDELFDFEVLGAEPARRDGEPGRWIRLRAKLTLLPAPQPVLIELWFDDARKLLRELRVDLRPHYRPGSRLPGAGPKGTRTERAEVVMRFEDIEVNAPLDGAEVTFDPPANFRQVDMFDATQMYDRQQALVGKLAPAVAGENLAGEPVRLADFRGRVVVLDFWAIWCAPCVEMLPTMQAVADRFADEPVTVLGVNRDGRKAHKRVAQFLKKKDIKLPQLLDVDDAAVEAFQVRGIPCTVILDRRGRIRYVHTGLEEQAELVRQIEAVLKAEAP